MLLEHVVLTFYSVFGQGVYFEKVLKSSDTSLWVRNIQMYLSGILVTLIGVYVNDGDKVLEKGFFFGYTSWVCFVVCECLQSEVISCLKCLLVHVVAHFPVCPSSFGQRGRPVHVCGGEVHRQHHEGLLRCSSHCPVNRRIGHPVWATDKYVRSSERGYEFSESLTFQRH